jgi:hypothetical protein
MTVRPIETLNQKPHTRRRRGRARPARRAAGQSPISDGAISRTHFADACASLWLDGELVHLDDLVLHDAGMDVRTPTHELTRAHAVLRARRRIAEAKPDWALSDAGLAGLRGRGEREEEKGNRNNDEESFGLGNEGAERDEAGLEGPLGILDTDPHLAAAFAAVDAANAKAERTLADETPDWDEDGRLDHWRTVVDQTRGLPPTPGMRSNHSSTRLGSAACSPRRCCATAAKRAGICRACMPG